MTTFIDKIVPIVQYENINNIDINEEYIEIINLIKEKMSFDNNNDKDNNYQEITSYLDIFLKKYFKNCDEETFFNLIKNGFVTKAFVSNILNSKNDYDNNDDNIDMRYNIILGNSNTKLNYDYKTLLTFLRIIITNYDLDKEYSLLGFGVDEEIDYLLFIHNNYYKHQLNKNTIVKLLNDNILSRYYADLLKFRSFEKKIYNYELENMFFNSSLKDIDLNSVINLKKKDLVKFKYNSKIIKNFLMCLNNLYFDREDGYETKPLDLSKETIIEGLDLYKIMTNRSKQVNLINFFEVEGQTNIKLRNDPNMLKDLLVIGEIFYKLKYNVYIVGAILETIPITTTTENSYWRIIPHKFDLNYQDIISKYTTNTTWIYLDVDFEAL